MHNPLRNASLDADQEYRSIEAALLESARGRWFLAEHGRRARRVDGALLEDALQRLKTSLREPTALFDQLVAQLTEVRGVIGEVTSALSERPAPRSGQAGAAPQPNPVQRILQAAELMHELAWTLQGREGRDFDQGTCEQIARQAAAIYALSREQAGDTEYTLRLIARLATADDHLHALLDSLRHEVDGTAEATHAAGLAEGFGAFNAPE